MSNTLLQPAALLAMLYGGAVTGLTYDCFRLLRRLFHAPCLHLVFDLLFTLCAGCITAMFLLYASGGSIRPYLLGGTAIGFFWEQCSFSYLFFHVFYTKRNHPI